jgi:tetratricopeptide (TPR) repeat protein
MTSVDELKAIGNDLMQRNEPKQAAVAFTKALQLDATNKLLLSNRSAAFLKMGRASRALQDADAAIAVDGTWLKAHFRRLQAQIAMNVAPDQLLITARRALEIDANAPEFIAIIKVSRTETVVSLSLTHSLTLKNKKKYDINDYNANFASKLSAVVPEPSPSPAVSVTTPVVVPSAVPPVSVIDPSFVQNPKFITAPNMPPVVLEFARKTVDEVLQQFDETVAGKVPVHLAKLQSTVFFLPVADIPLPVINVSQAFASPEMLAQCVQFLREAAQRDQILGSCSVVQRSVDRLSASVEGPRQNRLSVRRECRRHFHHHRVGHNRGCSRICRSTHCSFHANGARRQRCRPLLQRACRGPRSRLVRSHASPVEINAALQSIITLPLVAARRRPAAPCAPTLSQT